MAGKGETAGFGCSVPAVPLQKAGGPQSFWLAFVYSGASLCTLGLKKKQNSKPKTQKVEMERSYCSKTLSPCGSSAAVRYAALDVPCWTSRWPGDGSEGKGLARTRQGATSHREAESHLALGSI